MEPALDAQARGAIGEYLLHRVVAPARLNREHGHRVELGQNRCRGNGFRNSLTSLPIAVP